MTNDNIEKITVKGEVMGSAIYATEEDLYRIEFCQTKRFGVLELGLTSCVSAHVMSMFCTLCYFGFKGARVRIGAVVDAEAQLFGFKHSRRSVIRALDLLAARGFIGRSVQWSRAGLELTFLDSMSQLPHMSVGSATMALWSCHPVTMVVPPWHDPCLSEDPEDPEILGCAHPRAGNDFNNRFSKNKNKTKTGSRTEFVSSVRPEFELFAPEPPTGPTPDPVELRAMLSSSGLLGKVKKAGSV